MYLCAASRKTKVPCLNLDRLDRSFGRATCATTDFSAGFGPRRSSFSCLYSTVSVNLRFALHQRDSFRWGVVKLARQQILILSFPGSSPGTPSNLNRREAVFVFPGQSQINQTLSEKAFADFDFRQSRLITSSHVGCNTL